MHTRQQIKITGRVQGVGFRPCIYQIARALKLSGWVYNDNAGVTLEIQGLAMAQFIPTLLANLPPLAKIDEIHTSTLALQTNETQFVIIASQPGQAYTLIAPDMSVCHLCLAELFNPKSRFYQYPFLNCTHCGPRLTITQTLPYDRGNTTMATFPLCAACDKDYQNPDNRRYHAQPIACSQCGPRLSTQIIDIAGRIQQGEIIALKGLGGYQLICDARNETAIARLRQRKHRPAKPLALMLLNLASIQAIANYSQQEQICLTNSERPIVLLAKKSTDLPFSIAPGLTHLGIMLPSTPVHYLLFDALKTNPDRRAWLEQYHPAILIVTSANPGDSPLLTDDAQAQIDLMPLADHFVSYNRRITTGVDDSVMRVINQAPVFIRRARGYAPNKIQLPHKIPPTLALGGHLKNTFCITRADEAFLSQHIGDLTNKASREFFHDTLHYWLKFLGVTPQVIAHDLHPDYYSTYLAREYQLPTIAVQHHHAHLAAVAAEQHQQQPVLGLALDGHGYGIDGSIWGGELLLLDHHQAHRLAHLQRLPLPGGDKAARCPWYMGASVLHALDLNQAINQRFADQPDAALLATLLEKIDTPTTSSCGRLFDAAAALLGVHSHAQYEGQAAMKLESLVSKPSVMSQGWQLTEQGLSFLPLFGELLKLDAISGANLFHGTLIAGFADLIQHWSIKTQINTVLLSGGCFLNKILAEGLITLLANSQITALLPRQAPPNDGGIALGQAWIGGLSCA